MSRSRKILNMIKEDDKVSEQCYSFSNVPDVDSNEHVNAVYVIVEEHDASSPLPLGAEEIYQELGGILDEEVLQCDDDGCMETVPDEGANPTRSTNQPMHTNSAQPHDDIDSDQPTPFSLEVPSSYENSPLIQIEELEKSHTTTPVNMELSIPTPMPSPINSHTICDSDISSEHEDSFAAISPASLSTANSPAVSHSSDYNDTPKTTRKRQRRPNEWADVKRKCFKNLGKKYVTKKGKAMDEKTMGPSCKCRNKCYEKISQEQRLACFDKFWQLGDRALQWNFIVKYSIKMKKKRCLNQDTPNNRKYTYKYNLPLITGSSESHCERVEVCQTMFINTLSVSTRILKTAWKKYDGSAIVEEDRRGRHDNHKVVMTGDMKRSVCDHVQAFDPVESHYIRKNSKKLYLPGDLTIGKMFKMYQKWFDPEKYSIKATKERQYRDIVNSNFNIGFHIPKKDQCDECHVFRMKKSPTDQEKEAFLQHQTNKTVARDLKSKDKKDAEESNGSIIAAVFDFEKVLTCPHGNISTFYYKRKLSCFNFTIYDMGKKKAFCFMWDETVAKRGANEVSSCLLKFIEANVEQGAKDIRFWSDNCAGQNRNRFVFSLYVYAAKKFNIRIAHRFLQKGHTQNEGDSVHSVIERASQPKTIYIPDEWRLLVRWAKSEGEPYVVRNVTQNDVVDFKCLVNNKVWMKDIKGKKIYWSNIREVHANGSDPNKLFFKYDLTESNYDILVIRGNTRNSVQTEPKPAYSGPLKLPVAKYKDLVDMCRSEVIPTEYHSFFNSLPHHITVNDTAEESDEDLSE